MRIYSHNVFYQRSPGMTCGKIKQYIMTVWENKLKKCNINELIIKSKFNLLIYLMTSFHPLNDVAQVPQWTTVESECIDLRRV